MLQKGEKIRLNPDFSLHIPDYPIIPFITGDGIGVDITPVMKQVVDAAVEKAYGKRRQIIWTEAYVGEAGMQHYGEILSGEALALIKDCKVAIKGPLTTPVGKGMRSLNVALRQMLDLYVCLRPVRYYQGTPSPMISPEKVDMVIFRENSEDIYAGIEWPAFTEQSKQVVDFLQEKMGVDKIRFPDSTAIGIKPVSKEGTDRLVRRAIQYAIEQNRSSVTLVHKGNIMKYTEGAFRDWGYELAKNEFGAQVLDKGPWMTIKNPATAKTIVIKDVIADSFFQQALLRPEEYDVIATLNLNGDYISDALAAQVGGIGMAPGANIGDETAIFEATHGTAPKYAGQNKVNPASLLLSSEMMLRYIGWNEAADFIVKGVQGAVSNKIVTYDLERLMNGATLVTSSGFGDAVMAHF